MKLTSRDKEILQFINATGWCIAPQIGRRFSIKWWIVYRRMMQLKKAGLVQHLRMSIEYHGVFYLTRQGAKYTDLPPVDGISKGIYDHQRMLVDVVLTLRERYPEAVWISERHLVHEKFINGIGKRGHVSDGLLIFPDEKRVAIEVELSVKGRRRIEGILKSYSGQLDIKEVWYFCSQSAFSMLTSLAVKKSFIKIFPIKEFLA
jgi:hypothetical protein